MLSFGAHPIPFVNHLGFTLHHMANGESELRYTAQPEHLNTFDVTHGGASMTLMDVAMAVAARSLESDDFGCVTIEMKTSFMRPRAARWWPRGWCCTAPRPWPIAKARSMTARAACAPMPPAPSSTCRAPSSRVRNPVAPPP